MNGLTLIEQLDRKVDALLEALELIQGFGWRLDDSDHGREIRRRAEEAIALAKIPA